MCSNYSSVQTVVSQHIPSNYSYRYSYTYTYTSHNTHILQSSHPPILPSSHLSDSNVCQSAYGIAADMWSVGIVALEMFTGELNCDRDKAAYGKVAERKAALPEGKPIPDLMRRLLEEDPAARITAREALELPVFTESKAKLTAPEPRLFVVPTLEEVGGGGRAGGAGKKGGKGGKGGKGSKGGKGGKGKECQKACAEFDVKNDCKVYLTCTLPSLLCLTVQYVSPTPPPVTRCFVTHESVCAWSTPHARVLLTRFGPHPPSLTHCWSHTHTRMHAQTHTHTHIHTCVRSRASARTPLGHHYSCGRGGDSVLRRLVRGVRGAGGAVGGGGQGGGGRRRRRRMGWVGRFGCPEPVVGVRDPRVQSVRGGEGGYHGDGLGLPRNVWDARP